MAAPIADWDSDAAPRKPTGKTDRSLRFLETDYVMEKLEKAPGSTTISTLQRVRPSVLGEE
jgi:hypothetical protein